MSLLYVVVAALVGLGLGIALGLRLLRASTTQKLDAAVAQETARLHTEALAARVRSDAEAKDTAARAVAASHQAIEAERTALAHDRAQLTRERADATEDEARAERRDAKAISRDEALAGRETALAGRDKLLDQKSEAVERRDARLRQLEEAVTAKEAAHAVREAALNERERTIDERLAQVAGMTAEQAKAELLSRLDAELVEEQGKRIARAEKDYTLRAKELGIEVVSRAIQRYAAEHTAETTTAKIPLADEEMKGRIIGKEGRNIKAFEQATGVDVIIDDQPGYIIISCFDGVRREIAKRVLLRLFEDGRIHPARIEEELARAQQVMDAEVLKLGEDAAYACEVSGLHPQLLRLLGKLRYRTSYGQNVYQHTQEVAWLCGAMAADLGLDPKLGRRCGLMHDIGKAIDHEQEGSHPVLGHEALKRYNESEIVANAALAHHEGHAVLSAYTVLAAAADAISAARPGARRENSEKYLKRLQQLEEIACSFVGVQKAYAIQAGRELRVIVNGHEVPDPALPKVARDIAKAIEEQVAFPGEVKVTLIRETRQIAVAR